MQGFCNSVISIIVLCLKCNNFVLIFYVFSFMCTNKFIVYRLSVGFCLLLFVDEQIKQKRWHNLWNILKDKNKKLKENESERYANISC